MQKFYLDWHIVLVVILTALFLLCLAMAAAKQNRLKAKSQEFKDLELLLKPETKVQVEKLSILSDPLLFKLVDPYGSVFYSRNIGQEEVETLKIVSPQKETIVLEFTNGHLLQFRKGCGTVKDCVQLSLKCRDQAQRLLERVQELSLRFAF